MGFEDDLQVGVAVLLDAASVADWDPTGAYGSGDTGICLQIMPTTPSAVLMVSTFPVSDDPSLSDSVIGLQVQTRTAGEDPKSTNDLAGAAFDQLHGLHDITLSTGVHIVQCLRRSGALLGMDDLRRWVKSDNYYVTVWRPSPNRT